MSGRWVVAIIFFALAGAGMVFVGSISGDDTNRTAMDAYKLEDFGGAMGELDRITINYRDYEQDREGPVAFSHKRHALEYGVSCWECHHVYTEEGKNTWSPWEGTDRCIACHDPLEEIAGVSKLMTAFHRNCITCHEEREIHNGVPEASGNCGTCHLREITIENSDYKKDRMGPVPFEHRKHEAVYRDINGGQIPCTACHHTYEEGETIQNCSTGGCHDPLETKDDRQYRLRTAYHKACKECHRDLRKAEQSEDAPYIKCTSCHRR